MQTENKEIENELDTGEEKNYLEDYLDILVEKLKLLWGEELDQKLLLSKRGLTWLGINENVKSIQDIDEITFLNKMVDLGKLLSEDEMFSSNRESFEMSPSEARKIRLKLTSQKDVMEALNNKGNIRHKEVLAYINSLNEIIARDSK